MEEIYDDSVEVEEPKYVLSYPLKDRLKQKLIGVGEVILGIGLAGTGLYFGLKTQDIEGVLYSVSGGAAGGVALGDGIQRLIRSGGLDFIADRVQTKAGKA